MGAQNPQSPMPPQNNAIMVRAMDMDRIKCHRKMDKVRCHQMMVIINTDMVRMQDMRIMDMVQHKIQCHHKTVMLSMDKVKCHQMMDMDINNMDMDKIRVMDMERIKMLDS